MSRSDRSPLSDAEAGFPRALVAARQYFVEALTDELDLDTGIALITAGGHQAALAKELAAEMELGAGITSILGPDASLESWRGHVSNEGRDSLSESPEIVSSAANAELVVARYSTSQMKAVNSVGSGLTFTMLRGLEGPMVRDLWQILLFGLLRGSLSMTALNRHTDELVVLARRTQRRTTHLAKIRAVRTDVAAFLNALPVRSASSGAAAQVMAQIEELYDVVLNVLVVHSAVEDLAIRCDLSNWGTLARAIVDLRRLIENRSEGYDEAVKLADSIRHVVDRDKYGSLALRLARELVPAVRTLFDDSRQDSFTPTSS